jgi:hypothetical protein
MNIEDLMNSVILFLDQPIVRGAKLAYNFRSRQLSSVIRDPKSIGLEETRTIPMRAQEVSIKLLA